MSRFGSPALVRAWALESARDDINRHLDHGHDVNVYCTPGAREDWRRGYERLGKRSYEHGVNYNTHYQRGLAVRDIQEGVA